MEEMSSEKSDGEGEQLQPILWVKILPWRRNISHELAIIDKQRKNITVFRNQGSKPIHRERDHGVHLVSSRLPVPDLPRALYSDEWLESLDDAERAVLSVNDEKFEWMLIEEAHT